MTFFRGASHLDFPLEGYAGKVVAFFERGGTQKVKVKEAIEKLELETAAPVMLGGGTKLTLRERRSSPARPFIR